MENEEIKESPEVETPTETTGTEPTPEVETTGTEPAPEVKE